MEPDRWRQIEELFHAALQENPARRRAYLADACQTDPDLHREVLSLLDAHDTSQPLLDTSPPLLTPPSAGAAEFRGTSRFRLLERLGEGGFGTVYSALDRQTNERLALKVLRHTSGEAIYRFKREFRSLADIAHPNLVSPRELFSHDGFWFFTMELVGGDSFVRDARESPNPVERLKGTLRQLVEGLIALHEAGKLHRDIKPANVLVTPAGRTKILDFGLARDAEAYAGSSTTRIAGTPAYMAPEALRGHPSAAGDWYAVGVLVYEVLSGRPPFTGSLSEILDAKQAETPRLPADALDAPDTLEALCRALLQMDPKSRPTGPDILSGLRDAREAHMGGEGARSGQVRAPFVGRAREIAFLFDAFAAAADHAVLVPIGGPSGIGKTRLARHFVGLVRQSVPDTVTLAGRCFEQESIPYKAIDDLVDELSRHLRGLAVADAAMLLPRDLLPLTRLFPVLHQVPAVMTARMTVGDEPDAIELRRRAFGALRALVLNMARRSRVVLVLDDVQWGDADSGALLRQLLAPPDPPPVLVLGCYRSEERAISPFLRAMAALLQDARDARPLDLLAFTPAEAHELARSLLPTGDDTLAEGIASQSGGSPIFIELMARHAGTTPLLGVSMEEVMLRGVHELPDDAQRLLAVVAAAGQPVDARAAYTAADVQADGGRVLARLKSDRLVRTAGPTDRVSLEVYHDRIRSAVQGSLSATVLWRLRTRLAEALEKTDAGSPELLFTLYEGAGDRSRAASYAARSAAGAATALAFDQAARFYRLALSLDPGVGNRQELRARLADALAHAGRGREAAEVLLEAATEAAGQDELDLRRRAADQLLRAGLIDEGLDVLQQVLRSLGWHLAKTPMRAGLRFAMESAWLSVRGFRYRARTDADLTPEARFRVDTSAGVSEALSLVDNVQGAAFAARTVRLALRLGDPPRIARSLAVLGAFWGFRGGTRQGRAAQALEIATDLAKRLGDVQVEALTLFARAAAAYGRGRFDESVELCRSSLQKLKQGGSAGWERSSAEILLFSALVYVGRWAEIQERLPSLLQDAHERSDRFLATHALTRQTCLTRLMADDPRGAERAVEEGLASWTQRGFHMQHYWGLLGRTEVALYDGDGEHAWRLLSQHLPQLRRSLLHRSAILRAEVDWLYGRAGLAAASTIGRRALEVVAACAMKLRRNRAPGAAASGLTLEAGLLLHRQRRADAAATLEKAAGCFDRDGLTAYAIVARRCGGVLQGDDAGRSVIWACDKLLAAQGVVTPGRLTGLYLPITPL